MAAAAVVCAACGAKVRGDRVKCLRCGQPLVARQEAAPSRPIPWTAVGLVAGCLALGGFGIMLTGGSGASPAPASQAASVLQAARRDVRTATPAARAATAAAANSAPSGAGEAVTDLLAGQKAFALGNTDAAIELLKSAAERNPDDHRALNDLGQALVRAGRAREALPYFDRAVQLKADTWAYQFNRARAYAQAQQWAQAVEGYRTAARLFPDDYATHYNLAKALQASGNVAGALASYEKAIQLAPGQADFQLSYGLALEAASRPQDAAAAYQKYLELEPQSPDAEKVKGHLAELQGAAPTKGTE